MTGARALYPSSASHLFSFAREADAAGAAFLLSSTPDNLLEIVDLENGVPSPVEPGEALSMTVAPVTFCVTVKIKLGMKALTR